MDRYLKMGTINDFNGNDIRAEKRLLTANYARIHLLSTPPSNPVLPKWGTTLWTGAKHTAKTRRAETRWIPDKKQTGMKRERERERTGILKDTPQLRRTAIRQQRRRPISKAAERGHALIRRNWNSTAHKSRFWPLMVIHPLGEDAQHTCTLILF